MYVMMAGLCLGGSLVLGESKSAGINHFHRHVKPILERNCVQCHGEGTTKGKLALDSEQGVVAGLKAGVLSAKDGSESALIEAVKGPNPDMPKDSKPLSAAQVAELEKWIAAGAPWPKGAKLVDKRLADQKFWSLMPIRKPAVPKMEGRWGKWVKNPVDAFVAKRLLEQRLTPSGRADKRTLIRRLYFDLIGLPPSPEQAEQFLKDQSKDAFEKVVDKLLASPRYGERWARHWLDVVHYADTHGYDKDKLRPNAYPYRDYVIRSFNSDKRYDRFVQEQIAGDTLFPGTPEGVVAQGFIAAGPWDFIGHVEVPESKIDGKVARSLDRDDMVVNVFQSFMSTTVQCARCHNHKFDPISQEHYYNLHANFAAVDRAPRRYDADQATLAKRKKLMSQKTGLEAKRVLLAKKVDALKTPEMKALEKQIASLATPKKGVSPSNGYHSAFSNKAEVVKWVQIDLGRVVRIDEIRVFPARPTDWKDTPGFGYPVRFKIEVSNDVGFKKAKMIADRTKADVVNPRNLVPKFKVNGIDGRYVRVTATKLWLRDRRNYALALGEMQVYGSGELLSAGRGVTALDTIDSGRWNVKHLVDGFTSRMPIAAQFKANASMAELRSKLKKLSETVLPESVRVQQQATEREIDRVEKALGELPAQGVVYTATVHRGSGAFRGRAGLGPRPIHFLHRGDVTKPGKLVVPGVPPLVPGEPVAFNLAKGHGEGDRRAALARWVTHKRNPLTWRSIVNRVWLYHFGRGIVDSPNDFGRMGQRPTHPDLLDFLAIGFRDGGQSIKKLHKLIVMSATYQQASTMDTHRAKLDSGNRFLWRMNRRRLDAESIRDATLVLAGKMNFKMYGPAFRDFVLEKPQHSPHYEYHKHDPNDVTTHRRSIYRFLVRSQQQPFMTTLDCADPSMSVPKRNQTLTSLQALALMNNRFMLAMCEHMAKRLRGAHRDLAEQIELGYRLALSRGPTADELKVMVGFAKKHGLENTCRVLLNLNEFVFVD